MESGKGEDLDLTTIIGDFSKGAVQNEKEKL